MLKLGSKLPSLQTPKIRNRSGSKPGSVYKTIDQGRVLSEFVITEQDNQPKTKNGF